MVRVNSLIKGQPKVKIVAVAKDEGAYFSEWVHHHLYFGFDAIEIFINRTTDNSSEVLDAISQQHPNVKWQSADWIDLCPQEAKQQIQFIVYAKALQEIKESGEFTHVLFLDIDEFWCPQDYSSTIQDNIHEIGADKAIFFEWLNDLGNLPSFSKLPQQLEGNLSPLGKTILPVGIDLVELRHHVPLLKNKQQHVLVDGQVFEARTKPVQALEAELNFLKSSFIYHRAHRSAMEYVSLLFRGRPGNDFLYKNNRTGLPKKRAATIDLNFSSHNYELYTDSLTTFIAKLNIDGIQKQAEQFVIDRYSQSIAHMHKGLLASYAEMKKIFSRVFIPEVIAQFTVYRKTAIEASSTNVSLIREYAKDAVLQDVDEAIELMRLALSLRPKGPQIKRKLIEFEEIKAKQLTDK